MVGKLLIFPIVFALWYFYSNIAKLSDPAAIPAAVSAVVTAMVDNCCDLDVLQLEQAVKTGNVISCNVNGMEYKIEKWLGKGAHGIVFKAQRVLDDMYVLDILNMHVLYY